MESVANEWLEEPDMFTKDEALLLKLTEESQDAEPASGGSEPHRQCHRDCGLEEETLRMDAPHRDCRDPSACQGGDNTGPQACMDMVVVVYRLPLALEEPVDMWYCSDVRSSLLQEGMSWLVYYSQL